MASFINKCQTNIKKDILFCFEDKRNEILDRKLKFKQFQIHYKAKKINKMSKKILITTGEMLITSFLMGFVTLILYGITWIDQQLLIWLMAFVGAVLLLGFYLFILIGFIVDLGRYLGIIKTERFNSWY